MFNEPKIILQSINYTNARNSKKDVSLRTDQNSKWAARLPTASTSSFQIVKFQNWFLKTKWLPFPSGRFF